MNGFLETLNTTSAAALAAILNSLGQAIALAVGAWLVMRWKFRTNAASRHVLWWAVLAGVLLLPVLPQILAPGHSRPAQTNQVSSPPMAIAAVLSQQDDAPLPTAQVAVPVAAPATPIEMRRGTWPLWILAVWSALILLQLGRVAWSYAYVRRVKRRALPASPELRRSFDAWMLSCQVRRPARLLVSREIASPMAVGFRRPAVILPAGLLHEFQEPELDHVLLHELAHLARQDDWSNLAARLASGILVLHPVALWILRQIDCDREIACDDWVVSMLGEARPYAASLARLFELSFAQRGMMLASGMAENASHLGERIELLLRRGREFAPRPSLARLAVCCAALLALLVAGAQAPNWIAFAQDPVPPAPPQPPASQSATVPPAAPAPPRPMRRNFKAVPVAPLPPPASLPAPAQVPAPPTPPSPNARSSFLAAVVAAGYGDLQVDQIIALKNAGVSADFLLRVSQSGWGKLSPDQLIELTHRGITPDYLRKMKEAGLQNPSLRDVMNLHARGVPPEKLREFHALGFGPYTPEQAIQLTASGIGPGLLHALKDAGFSSATPAEIIDARNAGLDSNNLREARQYGSSLTLKQIIRLKHAGVI